MRRAHLPYRDIKVDGIWFHNTGTAVRHSKLELHEVTPNHDMVITETPA